MVAIRHQFESLLPDDPDAEAEGEVLPSHWNALHDVSGLALEGHTHAGEDIASGTVADARIAAALARDAEVASADATVAATAAAALAAEAALARNADNLSSGTVADARIAATIARDSEVVAAVAAEAALRTTGDSTEATARVAADATHAAAADPHTGYQRESEKGASGGYASLDGGGTVPDAQLPAALARDAEVTSAVAAEATARDTAIAAAIAALIASAPGLLDTLDEIAAALGDDPNFATTMTTALATKQPLDAELTALAGLVSAADRLPYFTGLGAASLATFTAFGRSLVAAADAAATRTLLGLGTAALATTGDFDAAGAAAAVSAAAVLDGDAAGGDLAGTYPNPSVVDDSHAHTAATLPTAGADLSGIDFLVGTASGLLSSEIVAGTAPGGELGGTWPSPTVDATHSGSTHAAAQAAAEATAAGALSTHAGASDPHPGYLTPAEGNAAYDAAGAAAAVTTTSIGAVPTARTISAGTGLTGGGDLSANRSLAADFGSGAGKVTQGNDSRLSDSRTPTAHAASHKAGGADDLSGVQNGFAPLSSGLLVPFAYLPVGTGSTQVAAGNHTHAGGGTVNDDLPWRHEINPLGPVATVTNWSALVCATAAGAAAGTLYTDWARESNGAINAEIGWDVVLAAGTWTFALFTNKQNNFGIVTLSLDGSSVGTIDLYTTPSSKFSAVGVQALTGVTVATAGKKRLLLKMASKNASSSAYYCDISWLTLYRTA